MIKRIRNIPSLTKYVIFSITFVIIYTLVEFLCSLKYGISHDTLTTCVYGFFAGEIAVSGLIKIFKIREEKQNDNFLG